MDDIARYDTPYMCTTYNSCVLFIYTDVDAYPPAYAYNTEYIARKASPISWSFTPSNMFSKCPTPPLIIEILFLLLLQGAQ